MYHSPDDVEEIYNGIRIDFPRQSEIELKEIIEAVLIVNGMIQMHRNNSVAQAKGFERG